MFRGESFSVCGIWDAWEIFGLESSLQVLQREWQDIWHKTGYFSFRVSSFKKPSSCLSVCPCTDGIPAFSQAEEKTQLYHPVRAVTAKEHRKHRLDSFAASNICGQAASVPLAADTELHFLPRMALLNQAQKYLCRAARGNLVQPSPGSICTDSVCLGLCLLKCSVTWWLISSLLCKMIFSYPSKMKIK